ncbi:FHA domain-containing protein [Oceanospirillum beijerinckii]|uniref:FHA domain-containing protein n=1 Tax=Oceanospirillum beijerinckii TaxID=64976 RepID=UPI00040CE555|nr:FHA domain-containing protein [Oceanospirillum beijerinckii]
MAKVINKSTEEQITLLIQHIFGRHPSTSHTVLVSPDVSRMHASIFWDGEEWLLQDSSSNGTYVNGKQVLKGTKHRLHKGDEVQFASPSAEIWEVKDLAPPMSLLVPVTKGLDAIELESLAVLPSEDSPEVTLYMSPNGHWVCESPIGISVLKTGDLVGTSEQTWRFVEARASDETQKLELADLSDSPQVSIHFDVSQNEEHVSLRFKMGEHEYDLGQRNHHYLLLLLARKRMQDKEKGLAEPEQGWVDKETLSRMLGQNENHINIQIYRFRKQLVSVLPKSFTLPQAIERRTREIRFAYDNVEICGGSQRAVNSDDLSAEKSVN